VFTDGIESLIHLFRMVASGQDLAVPITPGGGPQPEVELKQRNRQPTFGL
jgi:hypothetical protein